MRDDLRIASEWSARMYELLFAAEPSHRSAPVAFRAAPGARSYQVVAPDGVSARMAVLASTELGRAGSASSLTAGATALALSPVRVFEVDQTRAVGQHAQVYGADGAVVITYGDEWASSIPAPPPAAGTSVSLVIPGLPGGSGVLVPNRAVAGCVVADGRPIPGWVEVTVDGVSFLPDPETVTPSGPLRASFSAMFVGSDERWRLRCASEGVATSSSERGHARWVGADERVGLSLDVETFGARSNEADETTTIADDVIVVESKDIVVAEDDATVLLRRP